MEEVSSTVNNNSKTVVEMQTLLEHQKLLVADVAGFKEALRATDLVLRSRLEEISSTTDNRLSKMATEISLLKTTVEQTPQTTYLDQIRELIPTLCSLWFRGHCYVLGGGAVNMTTARDRCSAMGAYLVEIDDAEEQAKVDELMQGKSYWIGATDSDEEGVWKWGGSGRSLDFQNWHPGQPNNYADSQDCVESENAIGRYWNDLSCSRERYYACETRSRLEEMSASEISLLKTTLELIPLAACQDQIREPVPFTCSLLFKGHCYVLGDDAVSWATARDRCSCMGAYLVEIDDAEEQANVDELARSKDVSLHWIGATDLEQEGAWRWDSSGGSLGFENWRSDEPDNYNGIEHCAQSFVGHYWNDRGCIDERHYVCEKLVPTLCALLFRGHCYVLGDEVVNMTTARDSCSAIDAYLVEINDAEEQAKVDELAEAKGLPRYWIGATDSEQEGVWKWGGSDESMDFQNWQPNEPNDAYGGEDCAESGITVGRYWNDLRCWREIPYVCEKRVDP